MVWEQESSIGALPLPDIHLILHMYIKFHIMGVGLMVPVIGIIVFSLYIIRNESIDMMEAVQAALDALRPCVSALIFAPRRWIRADRGYFESQEQIEEKENDEKEEPKLVTITIICHPSEGCFSLGAIEP